MITQNIQLAFNPEYTNQNYWSNQADVESLTLEGNLTTVEQLLANYAVEKQDLENVMSVIEKTQSARIRLSLLAQLTNTFANRSLCISYSEHVLLSQDYHKQFFQFLNSAYWGTLLSALNIHRLFLSSDLKPYTNSLTTIYLDEKPVEFNAENITAFFDKINNFVDVEKVKATFKTFVDSEGLAFEFLKNGKLKMTTKWSPLFINNLQPYLFSCFYIMDKQWFMTKPHVHKAYAEEFKGVEFKKSKTLILTMQKEQADMFAEFYGIPKK